MRHTVVISDVHLCEGLDGHDQWMRWRSRPHFPDTEFARLVDRLVEIIPDGQGELVFNGDLFDFDAGRVVDGVALEEDLPRNEVNARAIIERILADHATYVGAVGRFLAHGHRVVFVSGNHDPQLSFRTVREAVTLALSTASGDPHASERVAFRSWFHRTHDGIHIEHGNQYDGYCAFRYPAIPHSDKTGEIHATLGSITFRHLISRMGYFNPHVDASWELGAMGYAAHWYEHYLFSHRSLVGRFLSGAVRSMTSLVQARDKGTPERDARHLEIAVAETGAPIDKLREHIALFAPPADETLFRAVRELWLDRVTFTAASAAAAVIPLLVRGRLSLPWALAVPSIFGLYEIFVPKPKMGDTYRKLAATARRIATIHGSSAVVFGHTHLPFGVWEGGRFFGNSGTWSADYRQVDGATFDRSRGKPVIWLRSGDGALEGGLYRFVRGDLHPHEAPQPDDVPAMSLQSLAVA